MKKLLIFLVLFTGTALFVNGQQYARYSQYMFNGLVLNPAYAGSIDNTTSLTAFYRNQWATISGAPVDISMSGHSDFGKRDRVGLGAFLANEKVGLSNHFDFVVTYAYKFPLNNGATFSAGLQGGAFLYQANLLDGSAPEGSTFDPALGFESSWGPNFGAGIYYYSDKMYFGTSIPYLLNYESPIGNDSVSIQKSDLREVQSLTTGGYIFDINNNLKFKPAFLLRISPTAVDPVQTDLTVSLFIKDALWVGNTWRFNSGIRPESTVFMVSFRMENGLRFGYAFDYSFFSQTSRYSSSHEVMVGFDIAQRSNGKVSPRYF